MFYRIADKVWKRWRFVWGTLLEREDAIQDAVFMCWRRQDTYDPARAGEATFFSLICYSTMNQARKKAKRQKRKGLRSHLTIDDSINVHDEQPSPEDVASGVERAAALQPLFAELTAGQRLAVVSYFGLEDQPTRNMREISEEMGVSTQRVQQLIVAGMARLTRQLSQIGIS